MITLKLNMVTTQVYLLLPDTDSLMHEINAEDVCENFSNDEQLFD